MPKTPIASAGSRRQLELAGRTAPKYHAIARPQVVEREATHRAIALAELTEVPILIVHVSGRRGGRANPAGARRVACASMPRPARNISSLPPTISMPRASPAPSASAARRRATEPARRRSGTPCRMARSRSSRPTTPRFVTTIQKARWSKARPRASPTFRTASLASRRGCHLLFSAGVSEGRLGLSEFVALTATNPAKMYGLHPRKGTIAIGADADLVLWDPEREVTISNDILHHNVDYTPYEGIRVRGWPVMTISRGEVVWSDGEFRAQAGRGEFLHCDHPSAAQGGIRGRGVRSPGRRLVRRRLTNLRKILNTTL